MRKSTLTLMALATLAGATAAQAQTRVPAPTADQTEFVGWLRFANGEFQLYSAERDVRRPLAANCISGAADDGEMRQAMGDLSGQKVRITGVTAPWSEAVNGRIAQGRSNIRNHCAGAFVIKADDIRPAN